ncbi:MAG TPA: BamA/TamA family outer membrane protein [Polyangia bacterium]
MLNSKRILDRRLAALGVALGTLCLCSAARAGDLPPEDEAATIALSTATAAISGVEIPETPPPTSPARAALVVPRLGATAVTAPVSGALTVYDRYEIREQIVDLLFNDARTFGAYPVVALETGLPVGVGARVIHRDLFGAGGGLRLAADYGGSSRHRLEGSVSSPSFAAGVLRARLAGGWLRQPNAPFYGIGDQDLARPDSTVRDLPARAPLALATAFGQDVVHAVLGADVNLPGPLFASITTGYHARAFRASAADSMDLGRTDVRFDTTTLTGWGQGTKISYSELAIGWDSLATASGFVPTGAPSTGTKVVLFGGLARSVELAGGGTSVAYTRYGLDGLRYFDLYNGDRVLILRGRLEGVAGAGDRIPFTDLPRLGGPTLLRGYSRDRFRDRVTLLASAEYRYPIWKDLAGYLFVDAGRVYAALSDLGDAASRPRVGGGGGLELFSRGQFSLRGQVAGSSEGLFFQLALQPVYRLDAQHYRI